MFKQESMFEAKVFLKSYADAIETIKEAAWKNESLKKYDRTMQRISDLKQKNQISIKEDEVAAGENFKNSREVKLFQFSNYVFKKYLPSLDSYEGKYGGFKDLLNEAINKLKKDLEVATSASQ